MIIREEGLTFIKEYVDTLNSELKKLHRNAELSALQAYWLRFILCAIIITNTLCWKKFERFSLGAYSASGLSWFFRQAKIVWSLLLQASVMRILASYGIRQGNLIVDDSDQERSKNTKQIAKAHKIKAKGSGGFFNGQNIVFLVFVSNELSIPVNFRFYEPNPALKAWMKQDEILKQQGVTKKDRPEQPPKDPKYPDKKELAVEMIEEFVKLHPGMKIKSVCGDCAYGKPAFMTRIRELLPKAQIISQIAKTQVIKINGQDIEVDTYFKSQQAKDAEILLRWGAKKITYCSKRCEVRSHGRKYLVIALKYDGEEEYRYLIAADISWRDVDVIKAYAVRWIVEVFIQDWKSYEGWAKLSKQRGSIGADRGVILSLLCDHMLCFHKANLDLFKNKKKAATVGSLRDKILMESLMAFIEDIVNSDDPKAMLDNMSGKLGELFELRESTKHLRKIYESSPQAA